MRMRRACHIHCSYEEAFFRAFLCNRVARADRIGWQIAVVWIEQHDVRAPIELAVGHQLIHISLADALLWIVDARRHPFPFRIDDEHGSIALPDDEIRFGPKPTCTAFE